jgi:xanthine dehydrogenase molybdopterin-binding subunit B
VPGVHAVLTGFDIPEMLVGRFLRDMPVLARDVVRFVGQKVAAVAAENSDAAEEAVQRIEVEYEELPPVLDPAGGPEGAAHRCRL